MIKINSFKLLISFFIFSIYLKANAQGTIQDYQRAELFNGFIQNKIYNSPTAIKWLPNKRQYFYSILTAKGTEFIIVDVKNLSKKPAFDQEQLAMALGNIGNSKPEAYKLPITNVSMNDSATALLFNYDKKQWTYNLATFKCEEVKRLEDLGQEGYWGDRTSNQTDRKTKSPDGKWNGYIKNHNVYIKAVEGSSNEIQLSFDGSEGEYYSGFLYWSPDSKKLVTNKIRPNKPHLIYLIESSPTTQLQPILQSRNYLKPGDALPQMQPSLFLIDSKKQIIVDQSKIQSQYALNNFNWRKDSRAFTFEYNKRGHQKYSIVEINTAGIVKELVAEESKTFISYSGKLFRRDLADGEEIIWTSERDGWNHLYLYDGNGKVKNQITKGNWVVRNVIDINEEDRTILFEASGMEKGQDPYFIQYYRVSFNGSGLVKLTTENGNHKAYFSNDKSTFIDTYSTIEKPQVTVLKDGKTGRLLKELESGNIDALLNTGWKLPEIFSAKGRDGETDIWGMIIRPSNFDPNKKYPVIEYIYAGPHDSFVPKSFGNDSRGSLHELAELGFIIVQIDGMGTSNRSKAFHDVAWKNIKDGGFPDRIAWIKEAAKKYNYMDITKVGIFGNSAGGQSSLGALLFHPDFYKVAVSSSGCHDNRMDKMWWNEQWMGYPIGPEYAASSNVDNAYRLQGKLLLILGELDDNVDPSSTMQVINQLIKANKNFDFLMVPGMKHSLGGDYGEHKRRDFFVKHLLGIDPPEWTWKTNITVPKP
ncbi:S9 family peptidase [Pedobacter polaris]|uniref:S9 family peptidase n=1 Tax=Pedobacter polaris TaxID=2571273 RepID=A0A4U1CWG3_9SPHI|nr:S9 family peptidase [Pedobacter polaris]TKC10639.1 S9 family peptidase [Pedobacter polaris]